MASVTSVISKSREDEALAPADEPILKIFSVSPCLSGNFTYALCFQRPIFLLEANQKRIKTPAPL